MEFVALTGELDGRGGSGKPKRLAGVELQEVDGLADIGVRLTGVLSDLVGEPGVELELAAANDLGDIQQERNARLDRGARPRFEGRECRVDGKLRVLGSGLLVDADNLGGARRIERANLTLGAQALAAGDKVVLAAQLTGNAVKRGLHGACCFRGLEVVEGFVNELALRGEGLNAGGKGGSSHSKTSLVLWEAE